MTFMNRDVDAAFVSNSFFQNASVSSQILPLSISASTFAEISVIAFIKFFFYARCITPKRVRCLWGPYAHHCARATQLLLKNVGNTVSVLTGPRFEPQTSRSRDKRVTARPAIQFNCIYPSYIMCFSNQHAQNEAESFNSAKRCRFG